MLGQAKVKHCIKRVDRLLGNKKLQADRVGLYKILTQHILGKIRRPIILLDWSQLNDNDKFYVIRASIPYGGRSLTLYEETHPKKLYDTHPINKAFLEKLKKIIPGECRPILVTDAGTGFRRPWFEEIKKANWDFVGRIRGGKRYHIKLNGIWLNCKEVYSLVQKKAKHLGKGLLTMRREFACEFFLAKRTAKKRSGRIKKIEINYESNDRKYSRRATDPWLLATSLSPKIFSPENIIAIYKQRMQIEELFRDTKNQRIGFSLKKTLTRNKDRLNILLLIGTLTTYLMFLIGKTAQKMFLHYQFQPNTVRNRLVLSTFNLGRQILLFRRVKIPIAKIDKTLRLTSEYMLHAENIV